jgi:GDP-L-fucose synthase
MGFKGELVFDTTRPDGELKRTASNSKMRMYLPNFKFTPFDDAIKETVEWFKATYPNVRK